VTCGPLETSYLTFSSIEMSPSKSSPTCDDDGQKIKYIESYSSLNKKLPQGKCFDFSN
jgi:hypothetical protein